ncbi:MAG: TolC family protein, partial [candidate division Zixibacteria bacterium]|nr:TolC family protein [candidate division Zixibacteria bacterium]
DMVALEEENVLAARQNLDLQRERHQLGAASSLEFRDAQASYALAQISLITARYQARISHLELERLIGELKVD